mmetsp:Transcript_5763/g.6263  ORF Transcript_5763/g.6263 Transcript_5763/m.6263 type:complete len:165 (+) Transcript_5763:37-531(+)
MSQATDKKAAAPEQKKKKKSRKRISGDYQVPEYITVSVTDPITHQDANGKNSYTDYKISTQTTLPDFKSTDFSVRRRYSEFVWLRAHLKQKLDEKGKRLTIAELPGNTMFSLFNISNGRFDPKFIEDRRLSLETFLNSVVNHPWARFEDGLKNFLEAQTYQCKD